jgi:hypothetical protein
MPFLHVKTVSATPVALIGRLAGDALLIAIRVADLVSPASRAEGDRTALAVAGKDRTVCRNCRGAS